MNLLYERLTALASVLPDGRIDADAFLTNRIDPDAADFAAETLFMIYKHEHITKILVREGTALPIGVFASRQFGAPLLVASKRYGDEIGLPEGSLKEADRVLIVTDILSEGKDVRILLKLAEKAGASVAGVGCAVENRLFSGADSLRNEGVRVESVCRAENGGFSPRIG